MQHDCRKCVYDCANAVEQFLYSVASGGLPDHQARDEYLHNVCPVVERVVYKTIVDKRFRELRADAIQETNLKLCNPNKVRTWAEYPDRSLFCSWAAVIARHSAVDVIRAAKPMPNCIPDDLSEPTPGPDAMAQMKELSLSVGPVLRRVLSGFSVEWQLIILMQYSTLRPTITEIVHAVEQKEPTIHFRRRRILQKLRSGMSREELRALILYPPVVVAHPLKSYLSMSSDMQKEANRAINALFFKFTPVEKAIFYMKHSPFATDGIDIAKHYGVSVDMVRQTLQKTDKMIRELFRGFDS